ncbi:ATP-binding cassette sub-family A member 3-like [Herpailurus yagouaroundi]|uniref:ATP-binding cassette sub-family A member 3-like n=1 Tax=Herpailurus yagouaroundi TaxID=1608482 RepID=UPI001AD7DF6E|nr:ATP-binding cassette sub-family A member 3-like [Puma yagouaroundi]
MIGLSNWMLWAAYFFTFLSLYSVIILLMCIIFFAKIEPVPVIQYSDPSLVFIFLLCFAIATMFFSFMVSTFFNKVHFAVSVGGFIYLVTYFPVVTVSINFAEMTFTQKLASCLSSNIAMGLGTKFLVKAEMEKIGIKWSNIFSPPQMENFGFAHVLGMFLFDAFLYGLVAWYIEAVFPGEYGVPKPWNFFLLRSYWFGEASKGKKERRQFYETNESKYFEAEPTNLVAGIQIKHLCKVLFQIFSSFIHSSKWIFSGVGYHMVMVKEAHCNVEEILKFIQYHIPEATLEKNVNNEISFLLPKEYTHSFEALFTDLEKRRYELGIASFGASVTTMEEVFFRVNNMEDSQVDIPATQTPPPSVMSEVSVKNQNRNMSSNERAQCSTMNESPAIMFNTGYSLYHQQFCAMFIKRALFSWRNWKLILLQMLALLGSFTLLLKAENFLHNNDEKARQMDLNQYGQTIVPLSISGNSNLTLIFLKHLRSMLESDKHTLKEVQGDLLKYLVENEDCIHLCIVAFSIEVKTNKIILTGLFNNQAYHSPSLTLSILDNILLMTIAGSNASLTVSNKPQPYLRHKKQSATLSNGLHVALNIHFGMALLISGFCLLTVTEHITKAKHIQFLSGVYVPVYWLSALLWDFIIFFITCCLLLGAFKFCQLDIYITDYHFLDTMLIFMLYGWSVIPLMYLLSFLFTKSTSAYIKLVLFNYLSGIFSVLIDATLQFEVQHKMSKATRAFILNSLLFFPNYNLAKCIDDYFTFYQIKKWCSGNKPPVYINCSKENPAKNVYSLEEKMIGKYMIVMSITGFICLLLLFFLDTTLWKLRTFLSQYVYFVIYKTFRKEKVSKELSGESDDEDVQNERQRILGQPRELLNSAVLIKELTKIYFKYPVILAVKNISVTIQKGECFGLLGFNGAGKTTTFKILTGEETVTSGDVFLEQFSITKRLQKVKSRVGYCPQSEALLEYMTGREIMIMYARLWGISEPQIQLYVNRWLNSMQLELHADKLIITYSGGTKRRLSTAIALMGNTSVILLDEPSTGMDPGARRLLWDALTWTRESGKAIIITSHRMEECDAFCTRLAIMVEGKFMCLGSPQHLKSKFGNIYVLKIKVKIDAQEDKLNDLKFFITMTFPGSVLKHENQGILNYYIPSKDNSWGKVFGILEEAKEKFNLEDYSISQITLEQVFLIFANPENTEGDYQEKKRRRNEVKNDIQSSSSDACLATWSPP